ncbi:MAG TPA: hypothetical protein VNT81_02295 [Vicinamibacterales bacterium]|nr:hypothetical protein [Vicinamibacterales bacterium]
MSATNGERARFHRNRKKRILRRMHLKTVLADIKAKKAAATSEDAAVGGKKSGPALTAEN